MSIMLADIDATCASLGYYDGKNYVPEADALPGLKVKFRFLDYPIPQSIAQFTLSRLSLLFNI